MEYNTTAPKMLLPEYGRYIQKLVQKALTIEDKNERTNYSKGIVNIMGRMFPNERNFPEFSQKLWNHLIILSDYKLDIDMPVEKPVPPDSSGPKAHIPYKTKNFKYKHFGKNIVKMLKFAADMEEGEEKKQLAAMLANHLKKMFLTWNKDKVEDSFIFEKVKELTDGKLILDEALVLSATEQLVNNNNNRNNYYKQNHNNGKKKRYNKNNNRNPKNQI